jgi:cell division septation protein DedD
MKKLIFIPLSLILLFLLSSCSQKKPYHHPKNPNYKIIKPKIKYSPSRKNLAKMVKELQGSPYVWAEEGPNNFDCSGFTYYLYGSMGIEIPRVARHQARKGKRVSANNLQYGDLIFFATSKRSSRKITHVGLYLGDGWFTHASTVKHEVVYSNLFTSSYYKRKLRICRRYLPDQISIRKAPNTPKKLWERKSIPAIPNKPKEKPKNKKITEKNKAIVIKAPLQEIEQSSPNGNFYVQVGSFVGHPKEALISTISQKGLHYKVIQFPKDGKQISKLLIGPYKTREKALTVLKDVQNDIEKNAFIAEIR